MSNCCDELKIEVAALRAEIIKLQSINEQSIIDKAYDKVIKALPFIVGGIVLTQVKPIQETLGGLLREVGSIGKTASTALNTANSAIGKIGELASKLAGIAAAIFALGSTIAILNTLGGRIDSVEASLGFTDAAVSRALGLIQSVKGIATRAESKADSANQGLADARNSISRLSGEVSETKSLARTALITATEGVRKADKAQVSADTAAQIANEGVKRGTLALEKLSNVEPLLDLVNERVIEHTGQIADLNNGQLRLRYDVDNLSGEIGNLSIQIPGINAKASQALDTAKGAKITADTASVRATKAEELAQVAETKAQSAILENAKLRTKINQLEQKDVFLEKGITQAQQEAYAALQLGGLGLVTAQNTAQGLSNVVGQIGGIGNTADRADTKASDALNKISTIRNGVVTSPQIENAIAQPIGKINATQQRQAEQIKQIEQKISNPGGVNTREVTRTEFEQIKQKLGEADNMNREGNAKLDEILAKLPALPAAVASATAARVPSVPQIKQAVGEATCESARSGCIAGALQNQSSGLQENFKQGLRDLEQGLNAGANAVQTALLTKIDTKLGSQIVGGIGGSLGKFYDWAHIDRALNVLTFAATVHNGMMLSSDIASTLTQALANALSVIGIKDKEGNALNISAIVGSTVENAIKGVIGAENYAQLSVNFALANRIYQSTANVLNNFQNTSSTILSGLEVVGSNNAKIGNALRTAGVVQENAYNLMNPQPKFNTITNRLQALQGGTSTILQVTQVPLDIISAVTELNQSTTELVNTIQNDDNDNNKGVGSPTPIKLTEDNTLAKSLSAGLNLEEFDLDADD